MKNTATKINSDFNKVADSLGMNRALSYLRDVCERLSIDVCSAAQFHMYHFSDGSTLLVSYSDARCEPQLTIREV